jgi:hypothetical protein
MIYFNEGKKVKENEKRTREEEKRSIKNRKVT